MSPVASKIRGRDCRRTGRIGSLRAAAKALVLARDLIGGPAKMVKIMIGSIDQNPAPKRIVLGSDA